MTVQDMAKQVLEISDSEGRELLEEWATVENATFTAYASRYLTTFMRPCSKTHC
ncbi:hypothetical protein ACIBCT_08870 [Streptosporangium sp. NPDC050855]|uniref:hypothetical protein n=1 Tax=Streptosporangium sp. NPDC050855 TaxID=3366194 RepID=UPI0037A1962F